MNRLAVRLVTLAVLGAAAGCARTFSGMSTTWGPSQSSQLTASDARVLQRVRLESRQGPIRFEGNDAEDVSVALRVGHGRDGIRDRYCPFADSAVAISATRLEGELRVRTARRMPDACVEEWTIVMPRRLVAEAEVSAGAITVAGVSGGVNVTTGVGRVEVRVTGGAVRAESGVGDVDLEYRGEAYGSVTARSNVGDISLWIDGRKLQHRGAPGSGDELSLSGGESGDPIRLTVNVGSISVKLGRARQGS